MNQAAELYSIFLSMALAGRQTQSQYAARRRSLMSTDFLHSRTTQHPIGPGARQGLRIAKQIARGQLRSDNGLELLGGTDTHAADRAQDFLLTQI